MDFHRSWGVVVKVHSGRGSVTLLPSDNEREAPSVLVGSSRCEPLGTRTGRGLKAARTHQKLRRRPIILHTSCVSRLVHSPRGRADNVEATGGMR